MILKANINNNNSWDVIDVLTVYAYLFSLSFLVIGFLQLSIFNEGSEYFALIVNFIMNIITILLVFFFVSKSNKPFFSVMGISRDKFWTHLNVGAFVAIILMVSSSIISLLFSYLTGIENQNPYSNLSDSTLKFVTILAVFIAPFVEEIFFRGFLQPAFVKSLGVVGGVIVTSLIFGLSHSQYLEHEVALVGVTIIGLILSITKEKTNSIMPCIWAHLINNTLAAISLFS